MDLSMEAADLYREEAFTDRQVGTIRRLSPVNPDGSPDASRTVSYLGQTQILTPVGALPLNFEIDASSLEEAVRNFGHAAQAAAEHTIEELRQMRRESASSLVLPDSGARNEFPGSGKIQFP
ncbi:MAG: hypothetical protein IT488_08765 [Gammaproteobacteria bacterium]|nr:hypothetical protein [Gammaproteobacteria bacterium]